MTDACAPHRDDGFVTGPFALLLAASAPCFFLVGSPLVIEMAEPALLAGAEVSLMLLALVAGYALAPLSRPAVRMPVLAGLTTAGAFLPYLLGESRALDGAQDSYLLLSVTLLALALEAALRAGARGRRIPPVRVRWAAPIVLCVWSGTVLGLIPTRVDVPPPSRIDLLGDVFERLTFYPHWDEVDFEREDLMLRYLTSLVEAEQRCGDREIPCYEFLSLLRDMLAELGNGHTAVWIPSRIGSPAVRIEPIEGQAVITGVAEDSEAALSGLAPGMQVLAVDGVPTDEAIEGVPDWVTAFASPHARRWRAVGALLWGPPRSVVDLELEDLDGASFEVGLRRIPFFIRGAERSSHESSFIDWTILPNGLGRIRVQGFVGEDLLRRFDRAVDAMRDTPGLILDLRDNEGGSTSSMLDALGRFFSAPLRIGRWCFVDPVGSEPEPVCDAEVRVRPRGPTYRRPVAVLIDETVFSAGEIFAHGLCGAGRARCFGRPTAGETDAVDHLELPGAQAEISTSSFLPSWTESLQGRGVQPDERIVWTIEDLRRGRDPDYAAARHWLLHPRAPALSELGS